MEFLCTTIAVSALILAPVQGTPKMHTVDYFDQKTQVTERVLDRTIVKDVARVQAPDSKAYPNYTQALKDAADRQAKERSKRACAALTLHCKTSPRIKGLKAAQECELVRK